MRLPVTLLAIVSVVTNMAQVLHFLASRQKLPRGLLVLGDIAALTNTLGRFLGRQKAMMGKDGNACLSQSESCSI